MSNNLNSPLILLGAFALWSADRLREKQLRSVPVVLAVAAMVLTTTVSISAHKPDIPRVKIPSVQERLAQLDTHELLAMVDKINQDLTPKKVVAPVLPKVTITSPRGRIDPFEPLVQDPSLMQEGQVNALDLQPHDVLEDITYTGNILDRNPKLSVAILLAKEPSTATETTLVKKVGETFEFQGKRFVVQQVKATALTLKVDGRERVKSLDSSVASVVTPPLKLSE
jgi:hypothetical protein